VPCDVQASDVWFSFVAPTAGITITSTNNESAAIYSGTCGSLTCHDEDALNTPWNVTGLTPGTSYFLKLGENNTLRESTIRVMALPANDECSDAIGLDVLPYQSGQGFVHGHTGGAATGAQPATEHTTARCVVLLHRHSGTALHQSRADHSDIEPLLPSTLGIMRIPHQHHLRRGQCRIQSLDGKRSLRPEHPTSYVCIPTATAPPPSASASPWAW
jgi:hypothetical protein